jgi:MFS family permease
MVGGQLAARRLVFSDITLPMLIIARVFQSLDGGGLLTLAQTLLGENVPPHARGSYQGFLSACIAAGATFAPFSFRGTPALRRRRLLRSDNCSSARSIASRPGIL